jgi:16S rRNA (uracil1498-N3)-methyltransferase
MRIPRLYCPDLVATTDTIALPSPVVRHIVQVLRLKVGADVYVFDGKGAEYKATLTHVAKREAMMQLGVRIENKAESPLQITLLQGISRGERMDYALQKAVELGVNHIIPVETARCNVNLSQGRDAKRWAHWEGVIISACEQSGRAILPVLSPIISVEDAAKECRAVSRVVLDPLADRGWQTMEKPVSIAVLIGPEGGLDETEMAVAISAGFERIRFGPRILRTETASVASLAVIQTLWGDCG